MQPTHVQVTVLTPRRPASQIWLTYWSIHGLNVLGAPQPELCDGAVGAAVGLRWSAGAALPSDSTRGSDLIARCQNEGGGFGGGPQQVRRQGSPGQGRGP